MKQTFDEILLGYIARFEWEQNNFAINPLLLNKEKNKDVKTKDRFNTLHSTSTELKVASWEIVFVFLQNCYDIAHYLKLLAQYLHLLTVHSIITF